MKNELCLKGILPKYAICGIDPTTGLLGFLKEYDVKGDEASNFHIPVFESFEQGQAYLDKTYPGRVGIYEGYKVRHMDEVVEEIIAKKQAKGFRRAMWALVIALLCSSVVDFATLLVKLGWV